MASRAPKDAVVLPTSCADNMNGIAEVAISISEIANQTGKKTAIRYKSIWLIAEPTKPDKDEYKNHSITISACRAIVSWFLESRTSHLSEIKEAYDQILLLRNRVRQLNTKCKLTYPIDLHVKKATAPKDTVILPKEWGNEMDEIAEFAISLAEMVQQTGKKTAALIKWWWLIAEPIRQDENKANYVALMACRSVEGWQTESWWSHFSEMNEAYEQIRSLKELIAELEKGNKS